MRLWLISFELFGTSARRDGSFHRVGVAAQTRSYLEGPAPYFDVEIGRLALGNSQAGIACRAFRGSREMCSIVPLVQELLILFR